MENENDYFFCGFLKFRINKLVCIKRQLGNQISKLRKQCMVCEDGKAAITQHFKWRNKP